MLVSVTDSGALLARSCESESGSETLRTCDPSTLPPERCPGGEICPPSGSCPDPAGGGHRRQQVKEEQQTQGRERVPLARPKPVDASFLRGGQ